MQTLKTPDVQKEFIHPELNQGEVFFTNSEFSWFEEMPFVTKRLGKIAYDGSGNRIGSSGDDWHPVFLNQEEIIKTGKSLSELRRGIRKEFSPT